MGHDSGNPFTGFMIGLSLLLVSCSGSTTTLSTWKDQTTLLEPYRKVVVASKQESLENRQLIEDAVVDEMDKAGIQAVASLDILPPDVKADSEEVVACMAREKAEGVMIITPIDERDIVINVPERTTIAHPSPFHSYADYWDRTEITAYGGYNEKVGELVTRRIQMWDCGDDRLVWQGESETDEYDNLDSAARSLAKKLVRQLLDERVVVPTGRAER